MVRLATVNDAEQLNTLNNEFNGEGETTLENIINALLNNQQEIVVVDEEGGVLAGFVCIQLKRSFCYDYYMPEIAEVYVNPAYRRRGIASEMLIFAEDYCAKKYPLHQYELLTGKNNIIAQSAYGNLGYKNDNKIHLSKRTRA